MIVGVPKEIKDHEYRVAMTPGGVHQLMLHSHRVLVETGAGEGSGFSDAQYEQVGAEIVSAAEAWGAQLVVKVKEPQPAEYEFLRPDLTLFTYLHLAADEGSGPTLDTSQTHLAPLSRPTFDRQHLR